MNKTNVPCYYYFNGYCNKGDRCSFLHDNDPDAQPSKKLVKTTSPNSEVLHLESNTLAGHDLGSAPTNGHLNSSAITKVEVDTKAQHKEEFQMPVMKDVPCQSSSPQIYVSEDEENATIRSDSLPPEAAFVNSIAYARKDQGLEELVDDQIDREERWESSPGFDVLVDGESENLDSEEDQDYLQALERGRRELNGNLSGYDFENADEYNSHYPDMAFHYESQMYYRYNPHVSEDGFGDVRNVPGSARVTIFDSILSHETKLMAGELGLNNHRGADLRDQLRRRRFIDNHSVPGLSRRHESSRPIHRSQERPWRHGVSHRQRHKRLASEVGKHTVESSGKNEIHRNGERQHGFPGHSQKHRSRKQYKEKRSAKRQRLSSESSRKSTLKERRSTQESPRTFSGPKTLAQIREEKRRVEENGKSAEQTGSCSRPRSTDFDGPRPLSEILKDKRKVTYENE